MTATLAEPLTITEVGEEVDEFVDWNERFRQLTENIHIRHRRCGHCFERICDGKVLDTAPIARRDDVPCDTCSNTQFTFLHRRKCTGRS